MAGRRAYRYRSDARERSTGARGTVRQGGKEELRASVLKTYLLRMRTEKGERAVRQLLAAAGIDPAAVDNETGWVSQLAAQARAPRDRRPARPRCHSPSRGVGDAPRGARRARAHAPRERAPHRRVPLPRAERARGDARSAPGRSKRPPGGRTAGKRPSRIRMTYRPRADGGGRRGRPHRIRRRRAPLRRARGRARELAAHLGPPRGGDRTHFVPRKRGDACVYDVAWDARRSREGTVAGALGGVGGVR